MMKSSRGNRLPSEWNLRIARQRSMRAPFGSIHSTLRGWSAPTQAAVAASSGSGRTKANSGRSSGPTAFCADPSARSNIKAAGVDRGGKPSKSPAGM